MYLTNVCLLQPTLVALMSCGLMTTLQFQHEKMPGSTAYLWCHSSSSWLRVRLTLILLTNKCIFGACCRPSISVWNLPLNNRHNNRLEAGVEGGARTTLHWRIVILTSFELCHQLTEQKAVVLSYHHITHSSMGTAAILWTFISLWAYAAPLYIYTTAS